jgi:hypothetical protein
MKMKQANPVQIIFFMFTLVVFVVGGYVYSSMDIRQRLENMESLKNEVANREGFESFMIPQHTIEGLTAPRSEKYETRQPPSTETTGDKEINNPDCPDILVKSGAELHLYNSQKPKKDGENPVVFKSLDEYIQYLEAQRKQNGMVCPILFLQKENDAQGNDVYRVRPSPFNTGAGLPISSNLNVGVNTKPITVKDASRESNYNTGQYAGFDPYGLYVGKITNVDQIGISTEKDKVSDNPMDTNWGGVLYTQKKVDSGKYDENIVTRSAYPTPKTSFIPLPNTNIPPLPPAV